MNYRKLSLSIILGLAICQSMFATGTPKDNIDFEIISSIEYIEEEVEIDLGFNTADYLPEDFNPSTFYFDVNSVVFIESIEIDEEFNMFLPVGFNAYAYPTDVQSINYIDTNDTIVVDLDTKEFLPQRFNAFEVK